MAAGICIDMKGEISGTEVKQVVSVPNWIVNSVFSKLLVDELVVGGVESETQVFCKTSYS
jgi:hypothetical protein